MTGLDLIEMTDRILAFDAVMKGNLKKETEAAKAALADFKLGKDLCIARNQLKSQQVEFEKYREKIADSFETLRIKVLDDEAKLAAREKTLSDQTSELNASIGKFHADQAEHLRIVVEQEITRTNSEEVLDRKSREVIKQHQDLQREIQDLQDREDALQHKLDVMKSL